MKNVHVKVGVGQEENICPLLSLSVGVPKKAKPPLGVTKPSGDEKSSSFCAVQSSCHAWRTSGLRNGQLGWTVSIALG